MKEQFYSCSFLLNKNNDIYKGHFLNNKKNGKGVLYYNDGSKYIGNWIDNFKSGEGFVGSHF